MVVPVARSALYLHNPLLLTSHQLEPRALNESIAQITIWTDLTTFLTANLSPMPSGARQLRFWIIGGLMLIMAFLNSATIVHKMLSGNFWLIKINRTGHVHPHLQILAPLFAVCNGALVFVSIVLLNNDFNRHLRLGTMLTQMLSYNFLFFCATTKIWAIVASAPNVPVKLQPSSQTHPGNQFPPLVFNIFVFIIYSSFPMITMPIAIPMVFDSAKVGNNVAALVEFLHRVIDHPQNFEQKQIDEAGLTLATSLQLLQSIMVRWRIVNAIFMVFVVIQFGSFVYSSVKLDSILGFQLEALGQARRRFARLASVGVRGCTENRHSKSTLASHTAPIEVSNRRYRRFFSRSSLERVQCWLWGEPEDQAEIWDFWDSLDTCTEVTDLANKSGMIGRFRTAVRWQVLLAGIVFSAFLVLTCCLTFNAFGVPLRTPAVEVALITQEWAGWAWALPGAGLSCFTCFLAILQTSSSEQLSKRINPSRGTTKTCDSSGHSSAPQDPQDPGVANLKSYQFFLPPPEPRPTPMKNVVWDVFIPNKEEQSLKQTKVDSSQTSSEGSSVRKKLIINIRQRANSIEKCLESAANHSLLGLQPRRSRQHSVSEREESKSDGAPINSTGNSVTSLVQSESPRKRRFSLFKVREGEENGNRLSEGSIEEFEGHFQLQQRKKPEVFETLIEGEVQDSNLVRLEDNEGGSGNSDIKVIKSLRSRATSESSVF